MSPRAAIKGRRVFFALVNTIALPLYVLWFGIHEVGELAGEVLYGWRLVFRRAAPGRTS